MIRQILLAASASFVVLPVCVFTHELGHYAVAIWHGWSTKLMPVQVTYQLNGQTDSQRILFLIAGPLLDALQIVSGIAIVYSHRNDSSKSVRLLYWTGMALAFVSVKWILTPGAAAFVPMNDEVQISQLLGWPAMALPILVMLVGIPLLIFAIKQHFKAGTWIPLVFIPIFGVLGGMTWAWIIGPLLLSAR